ncbi:MAG: Coenzyme F420 hydrogenase/dehydrogenase, beta subunit C-terminal domain [Firmicutes bacterium]|nr:Coenzyme F420 hydrogenase/dehydrogenase, beta subunit C-terminal domain [Bacillota bacterium]
MDRTKRFFYNTVATGLLQITILISGFIIPSLMLRNYGSETNGIVASISQFVSYFRLVEAGLASAAVYALYKPLAENNQLAINSIISATKKYYIKTGLFFSVAIVAFSFLYSLVVKTNALPPLYVAILVMVLGAAVALEFFTLAKYSVLLIADQRVYVISLSSMLSIAINLAVVAVLASFQINVVIVKAVAVLSVFVRSALLMFFTKRKYKSLDYNVANPDTKSLNKRWDALYLQILGAVQTGMPIVAATLLLSLRQVSVLAIYSMVAVGIGSVLSIFISGLSSSFGDIIARNDKSGLQKTYTQFEFVYYKIIAFFYACTAILITPFISVYTRGISDVNYFLPLFGILIVLNGLLFNLKTPQAMMFISAGMFKETRWQTTIQGILAFLGCFLFGYFWGLEGLMLGMIVSNLYRCIDLLFFTPKRITGTKISATLRQWGILAINIALIYLPFIFIKINAGGYFEWLLWAIAVGAYAFAVTAVVSALTDWKLFKQIILRVKAIFIKASSAHAQLPPIPEAVNGRKCYALTVNDADLHFASTSGGAFSAIMNAFCDSGAIIVGAEMCGDLVVRHTVANSVAEATKFRKSKYVRSDTHGIYRAVLEALECEKKVLFTGTGCQVAGLKSFLGKGYDNLLTVDFVCHGTPSPEHFSRYIKELETKHGKKISQYDFRSKENGELLDEKIVFQNGESKFNRGRQNLWLMAFLCNIMLMPSCYKCNYAKPERESDLTIADFWGLEHYTSDFETKKGVSLVLVNTEKGQSVFDALSNVKIAEMSLDKAVKHNLSLLTPVSKHPKYEEFNALAKTDFIKAVKKYCYPSTVRRVIGRLLPKNLFR